MRATSSGAPIEGVTSVAVVPSSDASTHLAFSTRYSQVVAAANEAKQCLQEALDAHNATLWWWQRKMKPPRSKLRGITRKGIVCKTPRFLTLFPLQGNLEASSEESPD